MRYLQLRQQGPEGEKQTNLPSTDRFTIGRRGDVPTILGRTASGIQVTVIRTEAGWDVHDGDLETNRPSSNGLYNDQGDRVAMVELSEVGDKAHLVYPPGYQNYCTVVVVDGDSTEPVDRPVPESMALVQIQTSLDALQETSQAQQARLDDLASRTEAVEVGVKDAMQIESRLDSHLSRIEAKVDRIDRQDINQDGQIKKVSRMISAVGAGLIVVAIVMFADSKHRDDFREAAPEIILGLLGATGIGSQVIRSRDSE